MSEYFVYLYEPTEETLLRLMSVRELAPKEDELYSLIIERLPQTGDKSLFSSLYKKEAVDIYTFNEDKLTVSRLFYDQVKWVPNVITDPSTELLEQVTVNVTKLEHEAKEAPFANLPSAIQKVLYELR